MKASSNWIKWFGILSAFLLCYSTSGCDELTIKIKRLSAPEWTGHLYPPGGMSESVYLGPFDSLGACQAAAETAATGRKLRPGTWSYECGHKCVEDPVFAGMFVCEDTVGGSKYANPSDSTPNSAMYTPEMAAEKRAKYEAINRLPPEERLEALLKVARELEQKERGVVETGYDPAPVPDEELDELFDIYTVPEGGYGVSEEDIKILEQGF